MPGVTLVCEENFIGVAAPDELCATRAIEAIQVEWKVAEGQPSSDEVFDYFRKHPSEIPGYGGPTAHIEGSVEEGLAAASRVLESSYTSAYIAHAPLEPRAAVAEWSAEEGKPRLTVWTGTQRPFGVRGELAETFGLSEDCIRVIVPDTGSGYGGKHTGDAAVEAARLARAAGKPVKLVWTREEEFAGPTFVPPVPFDIRSGVNDDGTITAWEYHNYNAGAAGMRTLYDIPHQHIEFHSAQSPLRQGSYRALAATANHFARETHMDELAHVMGMEPLAFRLKNLQDERLRAVLQAAAERFGWGKVRPSPDYGFGIAGGHEKGSYVATCAEVFVEPKSGE
jgi:isoquinoline 1-oxidoreductase